MAALSGVVRDASGSNDGSVKCNAFKTAEPTDAVIGCVYEIPSNQKPALDRAEGLGFRLSRRDRPRAIAQRWRSRGVEAKLVVR